MRQKTSFLLVFFLSLMCNMKSQTLYFPPTTGTDWDTMSPSTLGWCSDKVADLTTYLGNRNTKAFILLKDGKIVIEKYFGTFTQDSLWYWASAGKTMTSFMVGIAQQEKYLSIDDTASKYLGSGWTNCSTEKEEKITIRHQLTMTSGLDDGVSDSYCTLKTCLDYKADAGTRWAYHNGPYTLLDKVIENATGKSLNSYITQKIGAVTGISGAFYPSGYNNVFVSNARSMARFGLLILNHGSWNGTVIMSDAAYYNQMTNTSQQLNKSYGYLWWLNGKPSFMVPTLQYVFPGSLNQHAPSDLIMALGKNGQLINVVPSQNLVYIRMGNASGAGEVPISFNDTIWQKLNAMSCNSTSVQKTQNRLSDVKLYPNPIGDFCVIDCQELDYSVIIFDLTGRRVFEKYNCDNIMNIETRNVDNGIYTIQIQSKDHDLWNKKLIVSH